MCDLLRQNQTLFFSQAINFSVSVRVLRKDGAEAEGANIFIIADLMFTDESFTLLTNWRTLISAFGVYYETLLKFAHVRRDCSQPEDWRSSH